MTKYHEYRTKARKWDKLLEFIKDDHFLTNTLPINGRSLLRMSKDLNRLQNVEKIEKLVHLDILGEQI